MDWTTSLNDQDSSLTAMLARRAVEQNVLFKVADATEKMRQARVDEARQQQQADQQGQYYEGMIGARQQEAAIKEQKLTDANGLLEQRNADIQDWLQEPDPKVREQKGYAIQARYNLKVAPGAMVDVGVVDPEHGTFQDVGDVRPGSKVVSTHAPRVAPKGGAAGAKPSYQLTTIKNSDGSTTIYQVTKGEHPTATPVKVGDDGSVQIMGDPVSVAPGFGESTPAGGGKTLGSAEPALKLSQQGKTAITTMNQAEVLIPRLLATLPPEGSAAGNTAWDKMVAATKNTGYNWGFKLDDASEQRNQLAALLKILMTGPYMHGVRNQEYIAQIQQHLGDPRATPASIRARVTALAKMMPDMRQAVITAEVPIQMKNGVPQSDGDGNDAAAPSGGSGLGNLYDAYKSRKKPGGQ